MVKTLFTPDLRRELKTDLLQSTLDTMFGDGQEAEMVMGGISFKGLDNMNDSELWDEYLQGIGMDPDSSPSDEDIQTAKDDYPLFAKLHKHLAI